MEENEIMMNEDVIEETENENESTSDRFGLGFAVGGLAAVAAYGLGRIGKKLIKRIRSKKEESKKVDETIETFFEEVKNEETKD
ncbi:MAG: hypothetical protein KIH02_03355 [Parabacteroides sp.]|nr:hypothetical protein [Parabacteroides sp.]